MYSSVLPLRKGLLACALSAGFSLVGFSADVKAATIPYSDVGTPNPVTYTFTAPSDGDITAYFAGSHAGYDEVIGMLVNGVSTGITGLDDHTSALGQSFNLGFAHGGDVLTFVDNVLSGASTPLTWYSNPSLNGGENHVYSTSATAGQACATCPSGVYVAFEDETFPGSDFNYFDDTFVFTTSPVAVLANPLPATWTMMLIGLAGLGFVVYRRGFTVEARAMAAGAKF